MRAQRLAHGPEAPETQKALFALARAYYQTRDFHSAKATSDSVCAIRNRKYGEGESVPYLWISAASLAELGDLEGARQLQERILRASEAKWGQESRRTAQAMVNLATTLSRLGDDEGAVSLQRHAMEIYEHTASQDDPDLQWARNSLTISQISSLFPRFQWLARGIVIVGALTLIGFGRWALGMGLGVGGVVMSEGFGSMRKDRRRIVPRPTDVQRVKAVVVSSACAGGAVALLVLEPNDDLAQGFAGFLLAVTVVAVVLNATTWRRFTGPRSDSGGSANSGMPDTA